MQKVKVKRKLPDWFKVKFPTGENFHELKEKFSNASLNTVCEEAACPNIADCWDRKTATFKVLHALKDDRFCTEFYIVFGRFLGPFGTLFRRFLGTDFYTIR